MKTYKRTIIITGGAGFIGSHLVRLFVKKYPDYLILNIDKLTYAGNLANLKDIQNYSNYRFIKLDITDYNNVRKVFTEYNVDGVIHSAAESHVDRSIHNPFEFAQTNVMGTLSLLQASKEFWQSDFENKLFYHVSTDEVYGALGFDNTLFTEESKYDPHSPYSASKASSDHFVRAYFDTYGLPMVISNCSNNYGPFQYPEKLIPLCIINIKNKKPLPIYGKGENIRDWLYVEDHTQAIDLIFHHGNLGETYNVGGMNEWTNIDLVKKICNKIDQKMGDKYGTSEKLITYIEDRPGHDSRYAIDATKLKTQLGWRPNFSFEEGLNLTIDWYLKNIDWLEKINKK